MAGTSPSNPISIDNALSDRRINSTVVDPKQWSSQLSDDDRDRVFRKFGGYTLAERAVNAKSWVWDYGVDIQSSTARQWVCLPCVRKNVNTPANYDAKGTQNMARHLWKNHRLRDLTGSQMPPLSDQPLGSITTFFGLDRSNATEQTVANKLISNFDTKVFQRLLINWIIDTQQPFRVVEDPTFRAIFQYLNSSVSIREAGLSHDTVRRLVVEAHGKNINAIKVALRQAVSKIHIAFDGASDERRMRKTLFGCWEDGYTPSKPLGC
jgi:hypothetical protein